MFRNLVTWIWLICAFVAAAGSGSAEQAAKIRTDRSVDPQKAAVLCAPKDSRFQIHASATEATLIDSFDERYVVDYAALLVNQPGRQYIDELYRSWSKRLVLQCGRYTIEIETAFYNANPNGRMGAAPDYLIVAVSNENFQVFRWTSLGECDFGPTTIFSIDGKWHEKDRETEVTTVSQSCKLGSFSEEVTSSVRRVPSLQKALQTHQRAPGE